MHRTRRQSDAILGLLPSATSRCWACSAITLLMMFASSTFGGECETIDLVYTHNLALLQTFSCRFTVTTAIVSSREAALAGDLPDARVRRGVWKLDDGDGLYILE